MPRRKPQNCTPPETRKNRRDGRDISTGSEEDSVTDQDTESDVPDNAEISGRASPTVKSLSPRSEPATRSSISDNDVTETSFESKYSDHSSFNSTSISKKQKTFSLFSESLNSTAQSSPERSFVKKKTKKAAEENPDTSKKGYIIIAVMLIFVCIAFPYMGSDKPKPSSAFNQFDSFSEKINSIKAFFPSQETRFWRTVKASGKHVLNVSNPEYPAILLFVTNKPVSENKIDASSCLARKISQEFNAANMVKSSGSPVVDCGTLTFSSLQTQKMELDKKLRSYLDNDYKSVIVEHLELLSPSAALLLHGYCDNDNALYKDVMIILVLHVESEALDARSAELTLKQSWEKELDSDKVDALMSRVANNIVVVNPESQSVSSYCS